jgi:hypothetical protein
VAIYLTTSRATVRDPSRRHPDVNQALLEQPVPGHIIDGFMREDYRLGNSYFRSQRRRPSTSEERFYFPCTDLGDRPPSEWQTDDTLLVPLWSRDNTLLGVLDLYDPADRQRPTLDIVHVVEIFANQAAVAIENALQYREIGVQGRRLERQLKSQRDLLTISESVLSTLDERTILDTIADTLASLVEYDALSIAKVDEQAGELVSIFARDEWLEEVLAFRIKLGEGLSGWVAVNNEAVLCNDVLTDPRRAGPTRRPKPRVHSRAAAIRDKVIGDSQLTAHRTDDESRATKLANRRHKDRERGAHRRASSACDRQPPGSSTTVARRSSSSARPGARALPEVRPLMLDLTLRRPPPLQPSARRQALKGWRRSSSRAARHGLRGALRAMSSSC